MSRKAAREILYQLIFEYLLSGSPNRDTLEIMLLDGSLGESDREYVESSYFGVIEQCGALKDEIAAFAIDFKADRLFKTDLAALLLALYEIKTIGDIPEAVSINEAVNLVKKYSTEKSYSYVNGVLSGYVKSREKEKGERKTD